MKKQLVLIFVLFLFAPFFVSAQSIVGDWLMDAKTPDGQPSVMKVSFKADGKLKVDFGNDGSIDINGTYTLDGNKISLNDASTESPCYGKVGVYEMKVEGDKLKVKLIEDACEIRKGDGKPSEMRRVK
jgi:uncharacterized protein (TIGR03066 family)